MDYDYQAEVGVAFAEDLTYAETAPLLDALASTPIFRVRAARDAWSGPAAGGPEIGMLLTAVIATGAAIGAGSFAKSFGEALGSDAYKAVRKALLAVVQKLRDRRADERRAVVALAIEVDGVRVCIGPPLGHEDPDAWSDEWLVVRLQRAQRILDQELPLPRVQRMASSTIGPDDPCIHWER